MLTGTLLPSSFLRDLLLKSCCYLRAELAIQQHQRLQNCRISSSLTSVKCLSHAGSNDIGRNGAKAISKLSQLKVLNLSNHFEVTDKATIE
jgi:hypothetical protein